LTSTPIDATFSGRPLAIVLRAGAGAFAGWLIIDVGVSAEVPGWWTPFVAGALAVAFAVAPGTNRWAGRGITSGWAMATILGIYVGVPETDRVVAIGAVIAVIWLAELTGRMRVDALIVVALDVVLVWAAVQGAAGRSGAMIAGVATLGLLVVAPIVAAILRAPRSPSHAPWTMPVLVGLQFLFAIAVARLGGVRTTAGEAARVVVIAVPLLALAVAPIIARRGVFR
jgi:hypothetical protein